MRQITALVICVLLTEAGGAVPAQDLNKGMADLANQLNKSLTAQGFKKIAAVDFTNLQDQPTELGRSLTERLTVEITSTVPVGVRMVDRANTLRILDELKLSQSGLVDPANARKLGEFAGADGLLTGTVMERESSFELLVKVIATATAEIVAGGRLEFPKGVEAVAMHNRLIIGTAPPWLSEPGPSHQTAPAIATKDLGSLRVSLKSVLPVKGRSGGADALRCTLDFVSREASRPVVIALNAEPPAGGVTWANSGGPSDPLRSSIIDENGITWRAFGSGVSALTFVKVGYYGNVPMVYAPSEAARLLAQRDRLRSNVDPSDQLVGGREFISGSLTTIQPGQTLTVTMDFVASRSGAVAAKSFQLSSEVIVGVVESNGRTAYSLLSLIYDRILLSGSSPIAAEQVRRPQ